MTATLKTTIIQEPSSATANITLDASGNVAIGGSATAGGVGLVTTSGSQTLTNKTLTSPTINTPVMGGSVITSQAQVAASGTSITFSGIPSWVKRITVLFTEVSTSGTSPVLVQLSTGTVVTSGYASTSASTASTNIATAFSGSGFNINSILAANNITGSMRIELTTTNSWISSHAVKLSGTGAAFGGGLGNVPSSVTAVRITTVNGTDTFDVGNISITYE